MGKTFFFISSSDLSRLGAAQFRLLAIARGLSMHGAKVYWILLASKVPDSLLLDEKYKSINFIIVGKQRALINNSKVASYFYRLYLLISLGPVLRSLCCDSDHKALFSVGDGFLNLIMIKRLCSKETILLFHERTEYPYLNANSLLKRLNLFLYMNIFIPQCDHIFVISTALREFFSTLPKVKRNNVHVSILNMLVETDRYQVIHETKAIPQKDIVYIGTMYGDKDGVYNLIEAFKLIMDRFPDARLKLIGSNTKKHLMTKIFDALNDLSEPDRIIFTGALSRDVVIQMINQAYCLALARPANIQAKYGFPTKLGEYLSTGNPVVVTAVGDVPIFLKDGVNSYIAEPDSIPAFALKLEECLSDSEKAKEIGIKGYKLVYDQFDYRVVTGTLINKMGKGNV